MQRRLKKKDSTIAVSKPSEKEHSRIEINNILIDLESYTVFVDNVMYELPKKQFELLVILAKKPDKVHTREKIYDLIWGDTIVSERTIDVHIRKLREKLGDDYIRTIKGVGYTFSE